MLLKGERMVSVCIPCFNEEKSLPGCLRSIQASAAAAGIPVEIVVADNGSTDQGVELAKSCGAIVISVPHAKTVAAVRNAAAEVASGDWFAFIDADCVVPLGWVEQGVRHAAPDVVTGAADYRVPATAHWSARVWYNVPKQKRHKVAYIPSSNLWVSKELFDRLHGFAADLASDEDCDLCARASKIGARIEAEPSLEICHLGAEKSLLQFYKRHQWHGKAAARSFLDNLPATTNLRAIAIAAYYLVALCSLLVFIVLQLWIWAGMVSATLIAAACVMAWVKHRTLKAYPQMIVLCMVYGLARASALIGAGSSRSPRRDKGSDVRGAGIWRRSM